MNYSPLSLLSSVSLHFSHSSQQNRIDYQLKTVITLRMSRVISLTLLNLEMIFLANFSMFPALNVLALIKTDELYCAWKENDETVKNGISFVIIQLNQH